jgi:hypothetical protein
MELPYAVTLIKNNLIVAIDTFQKEEDAKESFMEYLLENKCVFDDDVFKRGTFKLKDGSVLSITHINNN